MTDKDPVSPYLRRPLRSLEEVLRQRLARPARDQAAGRPPAADNSNEPPALPPAKSA